MTERGAARRRHVVVVNQHGDNRGDEAALRAMLDGLAERLGPVRFTVVHQFADPTSCVAVPHDVTWVAMRHAPVTMVRSLVALVAAVAGLPWRWVADRHTAAAIDAHADADLAVSAPGGPYFGDLYAGHEPVHWLYARLAPRFGVPSVLYAPSAGPFGRRLWNIGRRWVLGGFNTVVVREHVSAGHVSALMGPRFAVHTTTDSALQQVVAPRDRTAWVGDRVVVAVSAIDLGRSELDAAVVAAVAALCSQAAADTGKGVHVALLPQLHGPKRDAPYLDQLAGSLAVAVAGTDTSVEVVSEHTTSDVQRSCVAAADFVLAGRYHPAVFALAAAVPVVCVAYQHKAAGVMADAGVADLVLAADDVTTDRLTDLVLATWADRVAVAARLGVARTGLQQQSARTSDLAAALVGDGPVGDGQVGNGPVDVSGG